MYTQVNENARQPEKSFRAMGRVERIRFCFSAVTALSCLLMLIVLIVSANSILRVASRADVMLEEAQSAMSVFEDAKDTFAQTSEMMARLNTISKQLEEADLPSLITNANALIVTGQETLSTAEGTLSETNDAVRNMVTKLDAIDIEKLNRSIDAFAAVIEPLSRWF